MPLSHTKARGYPTGVEQIQGTSYKISASLKKPDQVCFCEVSLMEYLLLSQRFYIQYGYL